MVRLQRFFGYLGFYLFIFFSLQNLVEIPSAHGGWFSDLKFRTEKKCSDYLQKANDFAVSKNEWPVDEVTEFKIQEIVTRTDLSADVKLFEAYLILMEWRIRSLNPVTRFFAKSAFESSLQKDVYNQTLGKLLGNFAGPHYNLLFNRISNPPLTPELDSNFTENVGPSIKNILTAMHENEHATHRNTNPVSAYILVKSFTYDLFAFFRTPITPFLRFRSESIAMGAEWELLKRLPEQTRNELSEMVRRTQYVHNNQLKLLNGLLIFAKHLKFIAETIQWRMDRGLLNDDIANIQKGFELSFTLGAIGKEKNFKNQQRKLIADHTDPNTMELSVSYFDSLPIEFQNIMININPSGKPEEAIQIPIKNLSKLFHFIAKGNTDPEDLIQLAIELKDHGLSTYDKIIGNLHADSLKLNPNIGKKNFLDQKSKLHGYSMQQLFKNHYNFKSGWRVLLYCIATVKLIGWTYDGVNSGTLGPVPDVVFDDLTFLIHQLNHFMGLGT